MGHDDIALERGMLDLFCVELSHQVEALNEGIVSLEKGDQDSKQLEKLMRAAHSIKGAARVVGLLPIEKLSHALEDYFVAIQNHKIVFNELHADPLFKAVDAIAKIKNVPFENVQVWMKNESPYFEQIQERILAAVSGKEIAPQLKETQPQRLEEAPKDKDRILRVTAQNLNRLMGLAGESMVESRWLQPFGDQLLKLKKDQSRLTTQIEYLRDLLAENPVNTKVGKQLMVIQEQSNSCLKALSHRLGELELFISRHSSLADRLYREVIDSRMRPFSDGVGGLQRMVRDLAKQLGKKVDVEISGLNTPVDRDILDKLETPLTHLLRNAIDHGIETPEERIAKGKPPEGLIQLSAEHRGGILAITITDDGRGVDLEQIRNRVISQNLAKGELAEKLKKQELLDFLFLPGFSTASTVTEISGRGMGLNVVQNMLQEVSGSIRITEEPGKGMTFHLSLPLTLSVIRALTVEIAGEPYAFPLARIDLSLLVPIEQVSQIENRQFFNFEGQNIGLVSASQVLEVGQAKPDHSVLSVVVLRDRQNTYGLVVDWFLGERELVIQDIETRLGKVPNISSGAFMEDGSPVLIIDVDDMINSIDNLLNGGRLRHLEYKKEEKVLTAKRRILVVDDSVTVREVESRLLRNYGYEVETAVNGMDAWNAVRMGQYDLVITDVDMPRMNGIELVQLIKKDAKLKEMPIMIVSYKEREQDRLLGMEAGADYYMTKSSFHDETLLKAVEDLIGKL